MELTSLPKPEKDVPEEVNRGPVAPWIRIRPDRARDSTQGSSICLLAKPPGVRAK